MNTMWEKLKMSSGAIWLIASLIFSLKKRKVGCQYSGKKLAFVAKDIIFENGVLKEVA